MGNDYSLCLKAALVGLSCAATVAAAPPARAQEGNTQIGPPQLRDFQLEPRQRIVTQPRPAPADPPEATPQPAQRAPTQRLTPAPAPGTGRPAAPALQRPTRVAPNPRPGSAAAPQPAPSPAARTTPPVLSGEPAAVPVETAPGTAPPAAEPVTLPDLPPPTAPSGTVLPAGPPPWLYFLGFAVLGLLGYGIWLRRRTMERRAASGVVEEARASAPVPVAADPPAPRPAPQPRPWLEIELAAERASVDVAQTVIEFELIIRNSGGTEARNVRLQARMFPSSPEQDKQIGAYFKADEKNYRTIPLPPLPAGEELRIKGSVDMDRERISALRVEDKLLLIPLVAVTARYEWGNGRFGQTGRSWVIGREGGDESEKMRPFRIDQGARVYRTIGQREHGVGRRL